MKTTSPQSVDVYVGVLHAWNDVVLGDAMCSVSFP